MLVALLVFGPEKLPEIASKIGKLSFQLKRASDGFRREFYNSVYTPAQEQKDLLRSEILAAKDEVLGLRSDAPKKEVSSHTKTDSLAPEAAANSSAASDAPLSSDSQVELGSTKNSKEKQNED